MYFSIIFTIIKQSSLFFEPQYFSHGCRGLPDRIFTLDLSLGKYNNIQIEKNFKLMCAVTILFYLNLPPFYEALPSFFSQKSKNHHLKYIK